MPSHIKSYCAIVLASLSLWSNAQVTVNGYHQDLDSLKAWVEEIHPAPYSRCTKTDLDSAFVSAHTLIDGSTTKLEFTKIIGTTLGVINDSHTLLNLEQFQSKIAYYKGELKLNLRYIDGRFYVMRDPNSLIELGTEITKINGIPTTELFNSALTIVPTEGNSYTSKVRIATILINDFALYDLEDGVKTVDVETSRGDKINYPLIESKGVKEKVKSVVDWVWPEEGDSIVKLKVKSFFEGKDVRYFKDLKRGFKKLNRSDYNHLVIDLRGNLGGSAHRMEYLLNYITREKYAFPEVMIYKQSKESKDSYSKPYKGLVKWIIDRFGEEHQEMQAIKRMALLEIGQTDTIRFNKDNFEFKQVYEGETSLLIDGLSASGSVSFASFFRRFDKGQIIGEPCMGPMTGTFGNSIERYLSNSHIGVSIASVMFALDSNLEWHSSPISPDRFIQISTMEMSDKTDPFQSAIDDWYNNPNVSSSHDFKTRESQILFSELENVTSLNRSWGGELRSEVFDLVIDCDDCLDENNKKIKEVEKSDASEDEILQSVTELYKLKKVCVEMRNAKIILKLPLDLRTTFEELTSPNRPSVLHFGIHNRADCNVCKK